MSLNKEIKLNLEIKTTNQNLSYSREVEFERAFKLKMILNEMEILER